MEANTSRPDIVLASSKQPIPQKNNGWLGSRVADRQIPLDNGKKESIEKRQLATDIYIPKVVDKPHEEPQVPIQDNSTQSINNSVLTEEELKYMEDDEKDIPSDELDEFYQNYIQYLYSLSDSLRNYKPNKGVIDNITSTQGANSAPESKVDNTQDTHIAVEIPPNEDDVKSQLLRYRIVGEVFNSYVIVEKDDEMLLVDKHAAHERIIFERLKSAMYNAQPVSQMLMVPIDVMMTSEEIHIIDEYKKEIESVGFEFTCGKYTASITATPEGIEPDAVSDMFAVIAERIKSNTGSARLTRDIIFEKALYQASCKAAIKAGREYPKEHIEWIVSKLMELEDITVCPHGRPVAMILSKKNLDNQFERT